MKVRFLRTMLSPWYNNVTKTVGAEEFAKSRFLNFKLIDYILERNYEHFFYPNFKGIKNMIHLIPLKMTLTLRLNRMTQVIHSLMRIAQNQIFAWLGTLEGVEVVVHLMVSWKFACNFISTL